MKETKKKAHREERWARCQEYIERTGTMDEARKLADKDGFAANTSVWISAYSKILEKRTK